ncbi:MAG: isoleucine--tRNA ligase [Enterobacteriaceae bacterium]
MINIYKKTLNLPKTKFPMKGNLIEKESEILNKWNNINIYKEIRNLNKNNKKFIIHDGPPYANGNIHIGHAVNKILKDIIVKFKSISGYNSPFVPGWDCHGLPIELNVKKKIKKFINKEIFFKKCNLYVKNQIKRQKKDFIRLGIIADWDSIYSTMSKEVKLCTINVFKKLISRNYIYLDKKPVYWCIKCKSSLAEYEVEYKNKQSTSIYVNFKVLNINDLIYKFNLSKFNIKKINFVVWTTTPWTLPSNCAVSVNYKLNYCLILFKNEKTGYILSKYYSKNFLKKIKDKDYEVLCYFKGFKLKNLRVLKPLTKKYVKILENNKISEKIGTGIVHLAPSHGLEDYSVCKDNNIKPLNLILKNGKFKEKTDLKEIRGRFFYESNKIILKLLKKNGCLLLKEKIFHKYPYCWRHMQHLIFRNTPQWFFNIKNKKLRNNIFKEINNVSWYPNSSKLKMLNTFSKSPDWCISRQRLWGTPIYLYTKNKVMHPKTKDIINEIILFIENSKNYEIKNFKSNKYNLKNYNLVNDILDVWFDSGCLFFSISKLRKEIKPVADLYLEGKDQYRGWFLSSLVISNAIQGKAPYKSVLTHGFVVDKNGKKMSKSLGNVIDPKIIINKFGADIFRLWISSNDYTKDIVYSELSINRTIDIYRKIRNTIRYLLANLNDFNPFKDIVKEEDMVLLDKFIIHETKLTQKEVIKLYNKYKFYKVVKYIYNFFSKDLSSKYFEIVKDRKYTCNNKSISYKSCQTAMYYIIESILRWIAPILSFTSEEAWEHLPGSRNKSIFLNKWYEDLFFLKKKDIIKYKDWKIIFLIRDDVYNILEKLKEKKEINSSLEVSVNIYTKNYIYKLLKKIKNELKFIFITSTVKIKKYKDSKNSCFVSKKLNELKIYISKSKYKKCERCWNYDKSVGAIFPYKELCNRCIKNLFENGDLRKFA